MSRMKTSVVSTYTLSEGVKLVLAKSGKTTNPQGQYPAWLEKQVEGAVIRLPLTTRYGWLCDGLIGTGGAFNATTLVQYWKDNLHQAFVSHFVGHKGLVREAPVGTSHPLIEAAKASYNAAQKVAAEAKAKAQKATAEAKEVARKAAEASAVFEWRNKAVIGAVLNGFRKEEIIAIEGDDYTLRDSKGATRTVHYKWISDTPIL